MKIYGINFEDIFCECDYLVFKKFVDNEKRVKLDNLRFVEDRVRGLYADLLVRYILIKEYDFANSEIKFRRNEYGKPHLLGIEKIYFNYSHSGNWIACAFDSKTIGIDVEEISDMSIEISKLIFSKKELELFNSKGGTGKKEFFFDFWTLKESYIKAIGIGLSNKLNSFTIEIDKVRGNIECNGWQLKQFDIGNNYRFSVCACSNKFPENISMIRIEDIKELFDYYDVTPL